MDNQITAIITSMVQNLIASGEIHEPADINTSAHPSLTCENFANDVVDSLPMELSQRAIVIGIDNFIMHDEDGVIEGSEFNKEWVEEHWPTLSPPAWFGWDGLNELSRKANFGAGTHIWVTLDGIHYDSECTSGVSNPLELPFFKRAITAFAEGHKIHFSAA